MANQKISGHRVLTEFLNAYHFVNRQGTGGPGLDHEKLLTYITRRINDQHSELNNWSIALVGNVRPSSGNRQITYGEIPVNRIQRSRKHTANGFNIGVLTEPDHLDIDLQSDEVRNAQNPLLLLYLIWKDSEAREQINENVLQYNQRINLYRFINSERVDVLGLAVILPKSEYEPNNYFGQ